MILSMTGFGKAEITINGTSCVLEIRALNSAKGLDLSVKLPSKFRIIEANFRNAVAAKLIRGKIDVSLSVKETSSNVALDSNKLASVYTTYKSIADSLNADTTGLFAAILQSPDANSVRDEDISEEELARCNSLLDSALNQIHLFRMKEGESILADILLRLKNISEALTAVTQRDVNRLNDIRTKMHERLEAFIPKEKIDANRFEQEVIYYLEKMDINEEVSRLSAHCAHFAEVVNSIEIQLGRKLNFIAQEMGREINTIGSKASDFEMQKLVVGMKDELEKVKEQTNNIL
jgi:uncharacterized protein (TIGR00255 family)